MRITVTTSVRVEYDDGDSSNIVETVRDPDIGGNRQFLASETARVLIVSAERVLDRMGGEEAAKRRPLNAGRGPNYGARIYGAA